MGKEQNLPVHGSVIQRSIIPEGLGAVLNIATVPISELDKTFVDSDSNANFRRLVGQVVGIPNESILDEKQYSQLTRFLRDGRLWKEMSRRAHDPYTHEMFHYLYRYWRDFAEYDEDKKRKVAYPDKHTALLGYHSLSFMMSPISNTGMNWPFPLQFLAYRKRDDGYKWLKELDITEEALQLGFSCYFSSLSAGDRVSRFTETARNYDIPSGQSPATRSDNLKKLIETSKKVCIAPLAIGGTTAISQLSQGNYVSALLATGTASAMSLILIGTISVADYLVHYLLHKRNSLEPENEDHRQIDK